MAQTRRILACDGGGIRGIITLRCLEAFETRFSCRCYDYFDMFAGTSTGALIAGSLALGLPVSDLIRLYTERRSEIFSKRLLGFLHPLVTKYDKKALHQILREFFGDRTLADLDRDIMITAVDTVRSETTFFSSFQLPGGGSARHGKYQKVRLRDAIEASASAPTYFPAHGRFIDGGATVYNNPAYMATVEALRYSSDKKKGEPSRYDDAPLEVYSFATGSQHQVMAKDEAMTKSGFDWLKYVISESSDQAGYHQSYVSQSELDLAAKAINFHRYDLYLTPEVIRIVDPESTIDPDTLALDAIDDERFELMSKLGVHFGKYLLENGLFDPAAAPATPFSSGASARIVRREGATRRWVQFEHGQQPSIDNYVDEVLGHFNDIDLQLDS